MQTHNCRNLIALAIIVALLTPVTAVAQQRIRDICRIKGQETNSLHGLGIVVGLNGTGDPDLPSTARALARTLSLMGNPLPKDRYGQDAIEELRVAKNAALVFVTATVPSAGARQGDQLNCAVHAFGSAKSLQGGYLMMTPLLGPRPTDDPRQRRVYAFAQGPLQIENPTIPVSAKIFNGCRLEENFSNEFSSDGIVTIVLEKNHADFRTAQLVARLINEEFGSGAGVTSGSYQELATAKDQVNVQVRIPPAYENYQVQFVSEVLDIRIPYLENDARVVINERTGTVIIGANVEIAPVAVTHKNFTIEAGPFFPLDVEAAAGATTSGVRNVELKALVDALNALKASPQDIIDIIKGLKRSGDLYGELIIE